MAQESKDLHPQAAPSSAPLPPPLAGNLLPSPWAFDPLGRNLIHDGGSYQIYDANAWDWTIVQAAYTHTPVKGSFALGDGTEMEVTYRIASIQVIYNPELEDAFALEAKFLLERQKTPAFEPAWKKTQDPFERDWRQEYDNRFSEFAAPYADVYSPGLRYMPLWHATAGANVPSIATTGFANLATTDAGFFGKGLYGARQARYSYDAYWKPLQIQNKNPKMLCGWAVTGATLPAIKPDEPKLMGAPNYANHDAHFIPVVPNSNNPKETVFTMPQHGQAPVYDELVVFQSHQFLPRYVVTFEPIWPPSNLPVEPELEMAKAQSATQLQHYAQIRSEQKNKGHADVRPNRDSRVAELQAQLAQERQQAQQHREAQDEFYRMQAMTDIERRKEQQIAVEQMAKQQQRYTEQTEKSREAHLQTQQGWQQAQQAQQEVQQRAEQQWKHQAQIDRDAEYALKRQQQIEADQKRYAEEQQKREAALRADQFNNQLALQQAQEKARRAEEEAAAWKRAEQTEKQHQLQAVLVANSAAVAPAAAGNATVVAPQQAAAAPPSTASTTDAKTDEYDGGGDYSTQFDMEFLASQIKGKAAQNPDEQKERIKMLSDALAYGDRERFASLLGEEPVFALMKHIKQHEDGTSSSDFDDCSALRSLKEGDDLARRMPDISAFQYAIWASDHHAVKAMIAACAQNKALLRTLSQQVDAVKDGACGQYGSRFSIQPLLKALRAFHEGHTKGTLTVPQQKEFWCTTVGREQRKLPAHIINEYYCSKTGRSSERAMQSFVEHILNKQASKTKGNQSRKMGEEFAIYRTKQKANQQLERNDLPPTYKANAKYALENADELGRFLEERLQKVDGFLYTLKVHLSNPNGQPEDLISELDRIDAVSPALRGSPPPQPQPPQSAASAGPLPAPIAMPVMQAPAVGHMPVMGGGPMPFMPPHTGMAMPQIPSHAGVVIPPGAFNAGLFGGMGGGMPHGGGVGVMPNGMGAAAMPNGGGVAPPGGGVSAFQNAGAWQ